MAVIYLKHSVHGSKVACSDLEAEYDEQNGWVRYTLSESVEPAPVEVVEKVKRKYNRQATNESTGEPEWLQQQPENK